MAAELNRQNNDRQEENTIFNNDPSGSRPIYPLTFQPVFKDYIWGGRELQNFGKILPDNIVAESWEASCHSNGVSIVDNGVLKGKDLSEVIEEYGAIIVGTDWFRKKYPLLIKFIDANEKLSIQVHPSDEYASNFEDGESGKNELWYIVSSKPGSFIYYGVKEGVDRQKLKEAVSNDTVEDCLNKLEVKAGDVINIPAGTLHAIGNGIVLIEIQQNSDLTYRLYDYNRLAPDGKPRPLHIEKALDVTDYSRRERHAKITGTKVRLADNSNKTILPANKFFAVEVWEVNDTLVLESNTERFFVYTLIDGELTINFAGGKVFAQKGESVLIPAQLGQHTFGGKFKAIKSYAFDTYTDDFNPTAFNNIN